ncbi:hypothetical protein [Polaromonas sp. UC242_47]|uniref:hypothetical protein n=1 Tax=Polaromonas sp. UC242_47 TaxID=3374626 RepID=UPI0037ABF9F4
MARLTGPRSTDKRQPDPAPQEAPAPAPNKGWPFAAGSQNHRDDTAAPWPRPVSTPARPKPDQ